jgi:hypothetical protein
LQNGYEQMQTAAAESGRTVDRFVVRLTGPLDAAVAAVPALAAVGVDEVIIEVDWLAPDGPERTLERMRSSTD